MLITKDSTFIMVGDSVTDCGRKRPDGEDISIGNGWGDGYVNLVRSHLGAFYPQYGIRVINKGNSGEQSSDLLPRWEEDVLAYKPEWVSILMGINDVWRIFDSWNITQSHGNREVYEKSMRHVIENPLPVTKNIILMAPYFIESNKQDAMRQEMDAYGAICKQLADEYGLFFIDLQATFDSVLEHVHPMYFGWDRIHPNAIGHTLIAKKILEVIEA
ncbi:MAG: SGNH/GDSL hydrolase family protein [Niameybacter sp.]